MVASPLSPKGSPGVWPTRRAAAVGLLAAIAALVWDPSATAAAPKRVSALAIAVMLFAGFAARKHLPRLGLPGRLLLGFCLWSGATLAWGAPSGIRDLATLAAGASLLFAARALTQRERLDATQLCAVALGGGASAIALVQASLGARGLYVHGGQGNGNWLGLVLALSLPLAVGCALESRHHNRLLFALAALSAFSQAAALVLCHARVAWVAVVVGAIATLPFLLRRSRGLAAPALLIMFLGARAAFAADPEEPDESSRRSIDVSAASAIDGRIWIATTSLRVAGESLPLGTGLGRFPFHYLEAQGERLRRLAPPAASRRFLNAVTAHNDWAQTLAETGPLGAALLLLTWVIALRGAWRAKWLYGGTSLAAFAVCALGDSPLHQPAAVLMLALVVAASSPDEPPRTTTVARGVATLLVACLGILLADAVAGWMSERLLTRAKALDPVDGIGVLERAVRIDRRSGEAALALGIARLETGDPHGAEAELQRATELLANTSTHIALGGAKLQLGRTSEALGAYRTACQLNPGSFRGRIGLAEALVAAGDLAEAREQVAIAKRLWPSNPRVADVEEHIRKKSIDP